MEHTQARALLKSKLLSAFTKSPSESLQEQPSWSRCCRLEMPEQRAAGSTAHTWPHTFRSHPSKRHGLISSASPSQQSWQKNSSFPAHQPCFPSTNTLRLFLFHYSSKGFKDSCLIERWKRKGADRKLLHTSKQALSVWVCVQGRTWESERKRERWQDATSVWMFQKTPRRWPSGPHSHTDTHKHTRIGVSKDAVWSEGASWWWILQRHTHTHKCAFHQGNCESVWAWPFGSLQW